MIIEEVDYHVIPMSLLFEADPSELNIRKYLKKSKCYAIKKDIEIIGVCLVLSLEESVFEIMNISVTPEWQSKGVGSRLLTYVIKSVRESNANKLLVGTGSFGYQLTFYQKAGFRVISILHDFFVTNYEQPIIEHGIHLRDMLKLQIEFNG